MLIQKQKSIPEGRSSHKSTSLNLQINRFSILFERKKRMHSILRRKKESDITTRKHRKIT